MASTARSQEQRSDGWGPGWWVFLLAGRERHRGVIVLVKPSDSLATLAVVAGIFVLIDGIFELVGFPEPEPFQPGAPRRLRRG